MKSSADNRKFTAESNNHTIETTDMKRFILMLAAAMIAVTSLAQSSDNSLYKKYSGKPGVSSVYISPAMFKLIQKLPEVELADDRDVHFERIIKTFEGMYIIEAEDTPLVKELTSDVEALLQKGQLALLMEVVEKDEKVRMYVRQEGELIKQVIMLELEDDSATYISIVADMPVEDFNALIQ